MRYFKYTSSKNKEHILSKGSVKIGTFFDYRRYENPELGDAEEGTATGVTKTDGQIFRSDRLPGAFSDIFKGDGSIQMQLSGLTATTKFNSNGYVFCLTRNPTKRKMLDFKYDCCYEIIDFPRFHAALSFEMYRKGFSPTWKSLLRECVYYNRTFNYWNYTDPIQVFFLKRLKFKWQEEDRIIFQPKVDSIEPVLLELPEIIPCIKFIEL